MFNAMPRLSNIALLDCSVVYNLTGMSEELVMDRPAKEICITIRVRHSMHISCFRGKMIRQPIAHRLVV